MHGALDSSTDTRISGSLPLRDFDDGAAFGDFLRTARERRGLTLQQISSETKIPWRHLDALEHGRLNAVPGGTYRRGEIRAYAEVVGIDKSLALARLDRALEAAAPQPLPKAPSVWRSIDATAVRRWSLLVVAAAIAGAIAMMNTWGRAPSRTFVPPESAQRESASPRASARPGGAPAAANAVNDLRPADISPPSPAVAVAVPPPAAPGVDSAPAVKPQPTGEAAKVPTSATTPAVDSAPAPAAAALEEGLVITSDPPGARVTIDGVAWGVTPLTIQHLPPGEKRLRVTKSSLPAVERTVRISAEHPRASVHVVLEQP